MAQNVVNIPAAPQIQSDPHTEPDGFVQEIVQGLRSIPHLPDALTRGVDEAGISDDERDMRTRALTLASQWVLPLAVSGAAAALPITGPAGILIGAVADAAGFGLGSGLAAKVQGQDTESAVGEGLKSAAFGGVIGAGMGAFKYGGEMFAKKAAEEATTKTAAAATAEDASKNVRRAIGVTMPTQSFRDKTANGFVAGEPSGLPAFAARAAEHAAGESPEQVSEKAVGGELTPKNPLTFNDKAPAFSTPTVTAGDPSIALALNGIEGYGISPILRNESEQAGTLVTSEGASRAYAPDQVLMDSMAGIGKSILKGDLHGVAGNVKAAAQATVLTDTWKQLSSVLDRAFVPARVALRHMGPAGTEMSEKLNEVLYNWRTRAGNDMAQLQDIFAPFNKEERIHIGEVIEGLATPRNDDVAQAADRFRQIMDTYADDAEQLGFREHGGPEGTQDFQRRVNYMTHYFNEKAVKQYLKEGSPEFEQAHRLLTDLAQTRSRAETKRNLSAWLSTPSEFRTGPLNNVRQHFDLPYEKDPLLVGSKYAYQVGKRLELAKIFGSKDELANAMYERIALDGGDAKVAKNIYSAFSDALPKQYGNLVKAISTVNIWTMMSTSGLVQPAQMLNVAAKTGYMPMLKAIGGFFRDPKTSDYLATKAGVHINSVLNDVMGVGEQFSEGPTSFFLKNIIGLTPIDKINRIVAATAGRFQLDALAEKMAGTQGDRALARLGEKLASLDVDPAELTANKFVPTEEMYKRAAYRASIDTQHATSILDQPELRNHAAGRIMYQFRGFAQQQGSFLTREIIQPAGRYLTTGGERGSLAPLARYAAGLGPMGYTIGNLVRMFKGKVAADDPGKQMLENAVLAGGFGIYADMIDGMVNGKDRILSLLAGPGIGEAASYLGDVGQATFEGKPEALAKHLVRRIPLVGQPLSNYWFFPPGQK